MLNLQTPETTTVSRYMVTRPLQDDDDREYGPWVLVADMSAGNESKRYWQQVHEAVKAHYTRICHYASETEAAEAVADCVACWGLGFIPTPPRAVEVTQTLHYDYRTFDLCEVFDAVGAP